MTGNTNRGDFIVGLLVGGALGATLALLYGPQTGNNVRDLLKREASDLQDETQATYETAKGQKATLAAQARNAAYKMVDDVSQSAAS